MRLLRELNEVGLALRPPPSPGQPAWQVLIGGSFYHTCQVGLKEEEMTLAVKCIQLVEIRIDLNLCTTCT